MKTHDADHIGVLRHFRATKCFPEAIEHIGGFHIFGCNLECGLAKQAATINALRHKGIYEMNTGQALKFLKTIMQLSPA